jgi:peptidoglycan/xylan/chitin deacetylase (PgdA/CDA1 family)
MSARTLRRGAALALRRVPVWSGVVVLNYHRIGDAATAQGDPDLFSATPEGFAAQLDQLARHADIVAPGDVLDTLAARRRGRHVAITFDDGYRDNHADALPALRARGLRAAFFVATGFVDRPRLPWWDELAWMVRHATRDATTPDQEPVAVATAALAARFKAQPGEDAEAFLDEVAETTGAGRAPAGAGSDEWMTWDMVRDLRDAGMEIGGHTVGHPMLSRLPQDAQRAELAGAADRLRDELGTPMRLFAHPFGTPGSWDGRTAAILRELGVSAAFGFSGGYMSGVPDDPYALPRTGVHHSMDTAAVLARLSWPAAFARW